MHSSTSPVSSPLLEPLEDRRLMSATTPYPAFFGSTHQSKVQTVTDVQAAQHAAAVAKAVAIGKAHDITPNISGSWSGKARGGVVFYTKTVDFTLDITKVTPTYAEGSITVAGHTFTGKLQGQTKPTEEFSYSYTKGKASVTVTGLLNGLNTAATGDIVAKYSGWTIKGTFNVTKIPASSTT